MRNLLDRQLGRVTMYRLVTIVLGLLVVVMLAYTAAGTFTDPFTVKAELITLVVLLVASYVSSRVCGLIWRVMPHGESAIITALLLWFIFWPSTEAVDLSWLAFAALLANLSKYVFAWRGRHVFNPAAAGAFLVYIAQEIAGRDSQTVATWWVASEKLLPYVAVGAFLVLWRTRKLDIGLLFVAISGALTVWALVDVFGAPFGDAVKTTAYSYPLVFLAGFMVSEPLTLPPRRAQQAVVAVAMALAAGYPNVIGVFGVTRPDFGWFNLTPQVVLLLGNLVAFGFARRNGLRLELESRRQLTSETHELTFRVRGRAPFTPGQYAELTVPHAGADSRGSRRSFSISSPPDAGGRMSFALRVPAKSSSFKRALLDLEPGDTVHGTGISGDFLWPRDPAAPLLLVAGGIGITPFLSQLRHHPERDVVLVYGVSSAEEVPFVEELSGARVVLIGPARPAELPDAWIFVEAPYLSAELIAEFVPDLAKRCAYVSGPPAMVNAVRPGLSKTCKSLKTDYFTGY